MKAPGQSRSPAVMQKVTLLMSAPSPRFYNSAPRSMAPTLLRALHLEENVEDSEQPWATQLLVLIRIIQNYTKAHKQFVSALFFTVL